MAYTKKLPWEYLEEFRGKDFTGEWPTFPEILKITTKRFGDRPYFTVFDGPNESKHTLTYNQVLTNVENIAKWMIENGIKKV